MRVIKKIVLSHEENNLFDNFTTLLKELKANLTNEDDMDGLWTDIDELETQVFNVWDNFEEE